MGNMFNVISNMAEITYVVKLLKELLPWDQNLIKLVTFLMFVVILIVVIEPEKLKWFNILATFVYLFIGKFNFT
jgi:hypothetical protein